jgi:hypothetical protein
MSDRTAGQEGTGGPYLPDVPGAGAQYWRQNELLVADHFLLADALAPMIAEADRLRTKIKKGGSVSYYDVMRDAPAIVAFYRSPEFIAWLSAITREQLLVCPENDPHACALYYYTEPGDHIGFHYDTSFYRGKRYTVLLGLVERSSCRLVCELFKDDPARETETLSVHTVPGTLVMFNGDKLWHAVTPSAAGDDRVVLSMEYVTDQRMSPLNRIVSNVKDAVAYFGIKSLLRGKR